MRFSILPVLSACALLCCVGCTGSIDNGTGIFSCESYTVTSDSIVQRNQVVRVTSNKGLSTDAGDVLWMPDSMSYDVVMISDNPLLDAVFEMSESKGRNESQTVVRTPLSILLSDVYLNPKSAGEHLMAMVHGGRVSGCYDSELHLPSTSDRAMWVQAVWEIYRATGDIGWLKDVYPIAERALKEDLRAGMDRQVPLMHGVPRYIAADESRYLPQWATYADMYDMYCLSVNVGYATACASLDSMASVLGVQADVGYRELSQRMSQTINDRFWIPNLSYYSSCLYGGVFAIQSQSSDNLGQALAVISGIARHGMGESLVKNTPVTVMGTPVMFPLSVKDVDYYRTYLWSVTQAYWNIAAARMGNVEALKNGVAALLRGAVFNDGEFDYASVPAVVLRGLAGIDFTSTGIKFSPCVPPHICTYMSLNGIRYREALLDIHIYGSGSRIKSFSLDAKERKDMLVPGTLTGHHSVDIIMDGGVVENGTEVSIVDSQIIPSVPVVSWDRHSAVISNYVAGVDYEVYVNGVMEESIPEAGFELYDTCSYISVGVVPVESDRWFGWSSAPHYLLPARITEVCATDLLPMRHHDDIDSMYVVDMSARHNAHIEFIYSSPSTERCVMDVCSITDSIGGYALSVLEVNGRNEGVFLIGGRETTESIHVYSNKLMVDMKQGANHVSLNCDKFINFDVPRSKNTAHVRSVRIIPMVSK